MEDITNEKTTNNCMVIKLSETKKRQAAKNKTQNKGKQEEKLKRRDGKLQEQQSNRTRYNWKSAR